MGLVQDSALVLTDGRDGDRGTGQDRAEQSLILLVDPGCTSLHSPGWLWTARYLTAGLQECVSRAMADFEDEVSPSHASKSSQVRTWAVKHFPTPKALVQVPLHPQHNASHPPPSERAITGQQSSDVNVGQGAITRLSNDDIQTSHWPGPRRMRLSSEHIDVVPGEPATNTEPGGGGTAGQPGPTRCPGGASLPVKVNQARPKSMARKVRSTEDLRRTRFAA